MINKSTLTNEDDFDEWFQTADLSPALETAKGHLIEDLVKRGAGRPRLGKKVTLILPESVIEDLRARGLKKGMGYQTYARMILMNIKDDEAS